MIRRPSRKTQLLAVLRKETLQTLRDRRVMFMLLVAPMLQLVVFGYAVDFQVDRVPTAIVDQDQSSASREHARRLLADGTLLRRTTLAGPREAEDALVDGTVAAALLLPQAFSRDLARGEARVQVLLDGTDPNRAAVAGAAVSRYFAEVGAGLAREQLVSRGAAGALAARPSLELVPRISFNPGLDTPPFMVPGVLGMLLVVVTTIVTAMGLAREREMGTLEQVLVTPIRPWTLLVGKMLPFVVIGLLDVALGLAVGTWLFDIPLRSLPVVTVGTVLYLMTTLGAGLLISTLSRTQQQSFLGGFLFAMPAILLSGIVTPIAGMPAWLQTLTLLNPVRYYAELMRAALLKGAGWDDLWWRLLTLLGFGTAILALATARFRKRLG